MVGGKENGGGEGGIGIGGGAIGGGKRKTPGSEHQKRIHVANLTN